jgi:Immunity protein 8
MDRPIVHRWWIDGTDEKIEVLSGRNTDDFCLGVTAMVDDTPLDAHCQEDYRGEAFQLSAATPKWLRRIISEKSFLFGRLNLFVGDYSYQEWTETLVALCEQISGRDWHEVGVRLSRCADWEHDFDEGNQGPMYHQGGSKWTAYPQVRNESTLEAELRSLTSPGLGDLKSFDCPTSDDFALRLRAVIGAKGQAIEETFNFQVCTPKWIERAVEERGYLWGAGRLIVKQYDYELIWRAISGLCDQVIDLRWEGISRRIGRFDHFGAETVDY